MAEVQTEVGTAPAQPSFPPFNTDTFAPQLVWLAITFVAFLLIMSRVALPKVARVLEEREDRIADDLDEAEKMRTEAEQVQDAYEAGLAEARGEAQAIALAARAEIQAKMQSAQDDLDAKLTKRLDEAEARISAVKQEALANIDASAREVAAAVVTRLTGQAPDPAAVDAAVTSAARTTVARESE